MKFGMLLVAVVLATDAQAGSHGAAPEDGVCFAIHERAVRYCVPTFPPYRLIEAEVSDGTVWAHFEENLRNITVYILPNAAPGTPFPTELGPALERSQIRFEVSRGIELDAWIIRQCGDVTVFEAMAQHDDFNEFYVEIIAPTEVLYLVLTDNSPEFDDVNYDFADTTYHVRDHSACGVVPLEDMTQILTR